MKNRPCEKQEPKINFACIFFFASLMPKLMSQLAFVWTLFKKQTSKQKSVTLFVRNLVLAQREKQYSLVTWILK